MHRYLVISTIIFSANCLACLTMPAEINRDHASLVKEAKSIAIFEVVPTPEKSAKCELKVLKVIKGETPLELGVSCRLPGPGDWMTNFENHSSREFWSRNGRLTINGDCSVFPPAFTPGKQYLALLGIRSDIKQYEELGENDRWLSFVQSHVGK